MSTFLSRTAAALPSLVLGLVLGLVLIPLVTPAPAGAAAPATDFTVVSAASYEGDFQGQAVPTGALLAIFPLGGTFPIDEYSSDPDGTWSTSTPSGLRVTASCASYAATTNIPILYAGPTQINVYWPNASGPERYGACPYLGTSRMTISLPNGQVLGHTLATVPAHPGIFFTGDTPSGVHRDGATGAPTPLTTCNDLLPAGPGACPVRTSGAAATVEISLTGSEAYACGPCGAAGLRFELARLSGGVLGPWTPQTLLSLQPAGQNPGRELATVRLAPATTAGEYRLRVAAPSGPSAAQSLHVEFGQPAVAAGPR